MTAVARRGVKVAALPFGALRPRAPGDLAILLYHRVGDGGSEIDLPPAVFERQMAHLAEHRLARTLDDGLAHGGVVVTFDDGTRDFADVVVPILERHGVPAVLYLATGWIGNDPRALSWAQVRDAHAGGFVEVGSHTRDHMDLSRADHELALDQMRSSKAAIEDEVGAPCRHFAMPWAVSSLAANAAARELFETSAVDAWRTNRRGADPYRLGRAPVLRSDGMVFFRAKVRGWLDHERTAYRVLRRGPWRVE